VHYANVRVSVCFSLNTGDCSEQWCDWQCLDILWLLVPAGCVPEASGTVHVLPPPTNYHESLQELDNLQAPSGILVVSAVLVLSAALRKLCLLAVLVLVNAALPSH
jgi:hypothetical protein